jgi:hypothetical protein
VLDFAILLSVAVLGLPRACVPVWAIEPIRIRAKPNRFFDGMG